VDQSAIAVIVLLGLVALRWLLLLAGFALIVRPVIECPACFGSTFLLQRRWLRRFLPWLEWRFCPHCGWQGPARMLPPGTARTPARHDTPAAHPFEEPDGTRL
jgi:hypothetical protein